MTDTRKRAPRTPGEAPDWAVRYVMTPTISARAEPIGPVRLLNLSFLGAGIEHTTGAHAGMRLRLEADIPGRLHPLVADGQIAWTRLAWRSRDGSYARSLCGVTFDPIPPDIDSIVKHLQSIGAAAHVETERESVRYILEPAIEGHAGSAGAVRLISASGTGFGIETERRPRPGATDLFSFEIPGETNRFRIEGSIVWGHLMHSENKRAPKFFAGVRVIDPEGEFEKLISHLCTRGLAQLDMEARTRKLDKQNAMAAARQRTPTVTQKPELGEDQLLLVSHVLDRLANNPEESATWTTRARFSMSDPAITGALGQDQRYRQEIVAAWEYLERSVPLSAVATVFRSKHK